MTARIPRRAGNKSEERRLDALLLLSFSITLLWDANV